MKGKQTWKLAGLSAKRWRAADQTRGPANLLPRRRQPLPELKRERESGLSQTAAASRPSKVLAELTITSLGRGTHQSRDLADLLKIIDQSQLPYTLTPCGTCIEGDWDEVMAIVKQCHQQARSVSTHVMTTIRIEDEEGATNKLTENVAAVERAAGRPLKNTGSRPSVTL